jgi:hypothetical protein
LWWQRNLVWWPFCYDCQLPLCHRHSWREQRNAHAKATMSGQG